MSREKRLWMWLVLCAGLAACAAVQPVVEQEAGEQEEIASVEEWCSEEGSLIALCDAQRCGLYRCREVVAAQSYGKVRLAQMVQGEFELAGPIIPYYRQWTQPPLIRGR